MRTPAKRATSRDVARLAGVSQTTVSLVINDVQAVAITPETRARVHEAVAALDYHPHEAARSLSRKATHTLGVAIPEAGNPHYLELADAIEALAEQRGYSVVVIITKFDVKRERRCLQWLKQRRMDALIVCSSSGEEIEQEISAARAQGYLVSTFFSDVLLEWKSGERELLEHLANLGHRRIGYIYGVVDENLLGSRLQSCLEIQRSLDLPILDRWVRHCGPTIEEGYRATQALLSDCASDDLPTALIVVNDLLAMGVLAALHANDITVPRQMSVAAFDNTYLARYCVPPLTSVDLESRQMGEQIAHVTLERLAAPDRMPARREVVSHLVVRASTCAARQL